VIRSCKQTPNGGKRHNKTTLILFCKIPHKILFIGNNMTVIRLTRMGRKKQPFYRIAVTDSRKRRDGGWIELIGHYNPMNDEKTLVVDNERLDYWLSVGAKMSDRVKKITGR
jgi:small subunit ribosomal protein S16